VTKDLKGGVTVYLKVISSIFLEKLGNLTTKPIANHMRAVSHSDASLESFCYHSIDNMNKR